MELTAGSYFGGRTPEDGRIDWSWPAERIHALIRAVAPPFPGAFTDLGPQRIVFESSRWTGESALSHVGARLYVERGEHLHLDCADGLRLEIPSLAINGQSLDARGFARLHGDTPVQLDNFSAPETLVHEEAAHTRR